MYFLFFLFVLIILLFGFFNFHIDKKENYTPSIGMSYIPKNDSFKYNNYKRSINENKIVVITSFFNYHFEVLYSFVKSLDNVNYKGHIILFVNKRFQFNLSNPIIHQLIVSDKFPYYSIENIEFPIPRDHLKEYIPINCHWNTIRYYVLSIWLKYYHQKYKYYYFCDGRDLFFQLNPSLWNFGRGVHLTLESDKVKIRNSGVNMAWTRDFKMGDSILNQHVINSGTIFGSSKEFTLFISQVAFMLKYINLTCNNDQGAFMYFYYSHPRFNYPVYLDKQGYGYALTVTDMYCDYHFTDYCNYKISFNDSKIKNLDGTIPIIVHGLERWKNTKNKKRRKEYYEFIDRNFPYYTAK